jgi:uncharacterized protein (TIGR01370 family)
MRQNLIISLSVLLAILFLSGCTQETPSSVPASQTTFHYQLQDASYESLKELDIDILIIDIDDAGLEKSELSALQENRIVLSYLSIGEAEDYRDYWQQDWKEGYPDFIDEENPEWEGNYKVRYWDPGWQDIILDRVQDIAEQGYDGVYLDLIDAYEYYEDKGRDSAADEMMDFVRKISQKGRSTDPDFLIIPQNAPELYQHEEYKNIIDGLGKEDTWYDGNRIQDTEETQHALQFLDRAIEDRKPVLAIDYPTEPEKICDFYERCRAHQFACTVSGRELDLQDGVTCDR